MIITTVARLRRGLSHVTAGRYSGASDPAGQAPALGPYGRTVTGGAARVSTPGSGGLDRRGRDRHWPAGPLRPLQHGKAFKFH
eukprot:760572-Hanusia_phi.AAC.1